MKFMFCFFCNKSRDELTARSFPSCEATANKSRFHKKMDVETREKQLAALKEKQKEPRPAIAKISGKQARAVSQYSRIKADWIKGKRCAVFPELEATEVHHKQGKVGYADDWARENEIPLLIDVRFWLPVSWKGHRKITDESQWAFDMGFTLLRTAKNAA